MIIVSSTRTFNDPQRRDALIAAAIGLVKTERASPGCRAFSVSADVLDPRVLHHYEEWDSEEDLQRHLDSPQRRAFGDNVAPHLVEAASTKFRAESLGPVV